jgi:hypothetical protein
MATKLKIEKRGDEILIVHCCYSILKQHWTIEETSTFSNSSHLEWRAGLSDTNLKGTHPGTIPARVGVIWFSGFREEDPFQNCVRQPCPPFKMAVVTKNRNFFNCPLLLYYKSK